MEKENKLGTMPISKLIINMSLPIIASMLVQALYNIVDSVFVSRVCEQALTAVSLAFPAQNLMIGLATGTAVGVNALMGQALGAKDQQPGQRRGHQRRIPGGGGLCHQHRAGAAVCGALLPVPDPNRLHHRQRH